MKTKIFTLLFWTFACLSSLMHAQTLFNGELWYPKQFPDAQPGKTPQPHFSNRPILFNLDTRTEAALDESLNELPGLQQVDGNPGILPVGDIGINPGELFKMTGPLVPVSDPTLAPARKNVKLLVKYGTGECGVDTTTSCWECSGSLIDSRHVLTAGHCIFDNGWADTVFVVPAYYVDNEGNGITPFGVAIAVDEMMSWTNWTQLEQVEWDMGVVFLDRPVGAITGWFGFGGSEDPDFYHDNVWNNFSYPGEDPYDGSAMYYRQVLMSYHYESVMIYNPDPVWWDSLYVYHSDYSYGGQSGSAYFTNLFGQEYVYAVLSSGDSLPNVPPDSTGVAYIHNDQFDHILDYRNDHIPPQLDLIPLWTQVSNETVVAGNMLENFSFKVHNYSQPTFDGPTTTKVFLSVDKVITEDDLQLGQITGSLFLGERQTTTVTLSGDQPEIPDDISPGEYYLGVALQLSDGDIANNITGKWDVKKIQVQNIIASPSHLEAQAVGDTLSFDITGNAYWFISEDAPWITLSQLNGTGNATIQVYCPPNPDASSREYELLVVGPNGLIRSVTVFQAGVDLDVSPTALVSEVCGDMVKFQVYSNFPWTVEALGITWIDILPYGGQQGEWVLLQCDPNGGDQARQAIIHVIAGQVVKEIVVTQSGAELTLNPSSLLFSPEGGEEALEVYSNTCWQLETDADWIFINQMSGEGNAVLQISCALNCGLTQEGIITLTAEGGEISQSILVTQLGAPLAVSPQLIQMPAIGGSQIIEITANLGWVATPADNWISLEPDSAPGGSQLILTCLPNLLATPRTTYVVVATDCSMELITIHQSGQSSFLFAEPDTIYFSPGIDTQFVLISSNAEWVVTGKPDWVDVSPSGSFGYDTLKVISQVNPGLLARFDTIELSAGGLQEYIFVFQESEFDEVITNEPLYTATDGSELENELPDGKSEYSDGFESGRKWKISIAGPRNPEATLTLFPNPFEELVTIVIELESPQSLSLDIQDLAGRRIALLAEGDYPKGKHEIIWSPQGLSKGVFICNLVTGEQILSRLIVKTQ